MTSKEEELLRHRQEAYRMTKENQQKKATANPRGDAIATHFADLKTKVEALERELVAERKKVHGLAEEKRVLVKERDDALLLRDSRVWPAAVDYILRVAPWNAMKITYSDAANLEVIQVEMSPVRWTFRQGDLGLVVEEHEITAKKTR